jgi:hypothetical protein
MAYSIISQFKAVAIDQIDQIVPSVARSAQSSGFEANICRLYEAAHDAIGSAGVAFSYDFLLALAFTHAAPLTPQRPVDRLIVEHGERLNRVQLSRVGPDQQRFFEPVVFAGGAMESCQHSVPLHGFEIAQSGSGCVAALSTASVNALSHRRPPASFYLTLRLLLHLR